MNISKNNTNITLRFINLLDNEYSINKFYIFIKNIVPDGISRIDSLYKDTKERLCLFFEEAYRLIEEESHQITFEEYLLERENSLSKRKDIHK